MTAFRDANQVRLNLKMKLSHYSWYSGCAVLPESDGYMVVVTVKELDNRVRKLVSPVVNGVSVKTEVG